MSEWQFWMLAGFIIGAPHLGERVGLTLGIAFFLMAIVEFFKG